MRIHLYKRGRVYHAYWSINGKQERCTTECTTSKAAAAWKERREREFADPTHIAANQTSIAECIKRYLAECRRAGKAAGTINMYECKSGHVARIFGAESPIGVINARSIDEYIETRETEGAAQSTIHKELTTIRQILKFAKRRGEYHLDPRSVMPIKFSPGYVPRRTRLTEEQVKLLLEYLVAHHPTWAAKVAYAIVVGARRKEIFSAQRGDYNDSTLNVLVGGTKTERANRTVPIPQMMQKLLTLALQFADGEGDRLFAPWPNARRDILRACKKAGVPGVTWNDLRRTFGSIYLDRGVSEEVVATMMGHASTKMIREVYGVRSHKALSEHVSSITDGGKSL